MMKVFARFSSAKEHE